MAAEPGVQIHIFTFGRSNSGALEDATIRIDAGGNTSAPIIYDLTVAYRVREQAQRS